MSPQPIKIVLLTDCLMDLQGGAEKQIFELAKHLPKTKFQIYVASLECEGQAPRDTIESVGCKLVLFPVRRIYGWSGIREGFRFRKFLKSEKIDIVQTYHFSSDIWGTIWAHFAGVKYIVSNRRDTGFWRTKRHVRAYRFVNRWVKTVIVNSMAGKDMVVSNEGVSESKIQVIYNGIDLDSLKAKNPESLTKEKFGFSVDDFVVMHVANFAPVKGHQVLLLAACEIVKKFPRLKIVLVGEGDFGSTIKKWVKDLHLEASVIFLGKRKDVPDLLQVADICVLPSFSEGMSNAILEYMAASKPVVATRVGGNPELIEHGIHGLLIDKGDVDGLRDALLTLMTSPQRRAELGQNGYSKIQTRFAMSLMVEKYENFFESLFTSQKFILHFISSAGLFGAENVVLSLARNLNKNGLTTIIAALEDSRFPHTEIVKQAALEGIPAFTIKCNGRWDMSVVSRLKKHLRYSHINLLHTHNYKSNLLGLLAARLAGVPIVSTAHGFTDMTRAVSFYEKFDRWILKFFDRVVVVTEGVLRRFPPLKKRVIKNGVDIKKFSEAKSQRSEVRKKFGIAETDIVIGTVGRLSREKNQMLLIKSAVELIKKHAHLKFLIVGKGPEDEDLRMTVDALQLRNSVIFTGLQTDLPKIYQAMDIFCLPSLTEGVPLTVLEAMAAKIPVVATRVGGVPGLIEEDKTGLLVESKSLDGLIRGLSSLIGDSAKRNAISENAFRFVSENFSQEKMIENYRKVYEEVLG